MHSDCTAPPMQYATHALSKKHYGRRFQHIKFIEKPVYPRVHRNPSRFLDRGGGGATPLPLGLNHSHRLGAAFQSSGFMSQKHARGMPPQAPQVAAGWPQVHAGGTVGRGTGAEAEWGHWCLQSTGGLTWYASPATCAPCLLHTVHRTRFNSLAFMGAVRVGAGEGPCPSSGSGEDPSGHGYRDSSCGRGRMLSVPPRPTFCTRKS